jgi:hypothetical protein
MYELRVPVRRGVRRAILERRIIMETITGNPEPKRVSWNKGKCEINTRATVSAANIAITKPDKEKSAPSAFDTA